MRRRLSPFTVAVVPVLLALLGNLATGGVKIPAGGRPWVWAAALALAVTSVGIEIHRQRRTDLTRLSGGGGRLADQADSLAVAVGVRWGRTANDRGISYPGTLPVRWRLAEGLTGDWASVRRTPLGTSPPPIDLAGRLDQIAEIYRRIPSGRLVVLGGVGSGKTVLAIRLVQRLLETRSPGDPVPVIINGGSWHPARSPRDWLAERLPRDYPWLAADHPHGANLATALVDAGLILPILDGFDEINPGLYGTALKALNDDANMPLVITSRSETYAAVTETSKLTAAAVIELDALDPYHDIDSLADYLHRGVQDRATGWDTTLARLRDPHDPATAVLSAALSTPLMVYLARSVYTDAADRDPTELLDTVRFPSREAMEEHLLAGYLPAVYQRQSSTGPNWSPRHAQRWLAYLARHLDTLGTAELEWSRLRETVPRTTRILMFVLVTGPMFGLALGLRAVANLGFRTGLGNAVLAGLTLGLTVGLVHGLRRAGPRPARTRLRLAGSLRHVRREFLSGVWLGGVSAIVFLLLIAIAGALVGEYSPLWLIAMMTVGVVMIGIPTGGLVGLLFGTAFGLNAWFEAPIDKTSTTNPTVTLASDRANTVRRFLAFGLVLGLALAPAGLAAWPNAWLTFALLGGLTTAWSQWLVLVRVPLPLTGRLPWRVNAFLADAHDRGVLRQAGTGYQFRHELLRTHLAHQGSDPRR